MGALGGDYSFWCAVGIWQLYSFGTVGCLTARTSWHLSYLSTWFSPSFWKLILQECFIFVLILMQTMSGLLTRAWTVSCVEVRPWALVILFCMALLNVALFLGLVAQAQVRVSPTRLCRRRAGWQFNFAVGFSLGILIFPVTVGIADERWGAAFALLIIILGFAQVVLLRGAALQGFSSAYTVVFIHQNFKESRCLGWTAIPSLYLPILILEFIGSTAETARDTRLWQTVVKACTAAAWVGFNQHQLNVLSQVTCITIVFGVGHSHKLYSRRMRNVQHWAGAIAMLKFSELRRRRAEDVTFTLSRRQDMDPEIFGDPTRARHIIPVSHAWLDRRHADPDGLHLDLVLARVQEKLGAPGRIGVPGRIRQWWFSYYYLQAEGDVLLFFDMSSMAQKPRTLAEQADFKKALGLLHFLYFSFDVLAIPTIPNNVSHCGHHMTYLERGWCFAEATIARLGGRLHLYSQDIVQELDKELELQKLHGMSLPDALQGLPPYPPELLDFARKEDLMKFRLQQQHIKGKVFSNGKSDWLQVSRILVKMELQQTLRKLLESKDVVGVKNLFGDDTRFKKHLGGFSREELANVAFDGTFRTPLHLAVEADSVELVQFLVSIGARPQRSFSGYLPWERFCFIPRLTAAAKAARAPGRWDPASSISPSTSTMSSAMSILSSDGYRDML